AWIHSVLATVRRPLWAVALQPGRLRLQRHIRRSVWQLGLADTLRPQHHPGRYRPLDTPRYPRDADLREASCGEKGRAATDSRGDQTQPQGDHRLRLRAGG